MTATFQLPRRANRFRALPALWFTWLALCTSATRAEDEFPSFRVPGSQPAMHSLESLLRLHYGPRIQTTLWDGWIPRASLWEAVGPAGQESAESMRSYYRDSLLNRKIDAEGYVATQQHRGLAHSDGWPFPTWAQSRGIGWHFSLEGDDYAVQLGIPHTTSLNGWDVQGLDSHPIDPAVGATFQVVAPEALLTTPPCEVPPEVWPFVRLEWLARDLHPSARIYLEWATSRDPEFHPSRRMELAHPGAAMQYLNIPLYRHPEARGTLTRLRLRIEAAPAATLVLKSLITAIDTRHPINNALYLTACCDYFKITTDLEFLKANTARMRTALQFALYEFDVKKQGMVVVPWVGHDGRTGLVRPDGGKATLLYGRGVGNNYWDLLPFGARDFQATLYLFHALRQLAALDRAVAAHPEWGILDGPNPCPAQQLDDLAELMRREGGRRFWNQATGRFVGWIDGDGQAHDFGFTTLNTEAITYGFAQADQARSILDWLSGRREVATDTSQGADLYHWRFAPRATTVRNTSIYCWVWSGPETIPWGNQVQDGGAVLGFSYFDLMARLRTLGPNDAWTRLSEILAWFDEVQAEGGYRAYYRKPDRGTLQGGGPPGGLGLDAEFFESLLVPQVVLDGFLGFEPEPGGFAIAPQLPTGWPSLAVTRVAVQDVVLDLEATPTAIYVSTRRAPANGTTLQVRVDGAAVPITVRCKAGETVPLPRPR